MKPAEGEAAKPLAENGGSKDLRSQVVTWRSMGNVKGLRVKGLGVGFSVSGLRFRGLGFAV